MDPGYVVLACVFIMFAIAVHLLRRCNRGWMTKNLHRGDLHALADVAGGKQFGLQRDRLVRLCRRGFAIENAWGGCRATLKGHYAAFLLRVRAKNKPAEHGQPRTGSRA
jgi:hypothetical protein